MLLGPLHSGRHDVLRLLRGLRSPCQPQRCHGRHGEHHGCCAGGQPLPGDRLSAAHPRQQQCARGPDRHGETATSHPVTAVPLRLTSAGVPG